MAIDVSQMAVAQRLKETVTVTRADLGNNTTVNVATAVEIVILPATAQGDQIQGTGLVTIQGYYQGYLLAPNGNIQTGDIVTRVAGADPEVLYIQDVFEVGGVQWTNLTTRRTTG